MCGQASWRRFKAQARRDGRALRRDLAAVGEDLRAAGDDLARAFEDWDAQPSAWGRSSKVERHARRRAARAAPTGASPSRRRCGQASSWAWVAFALSFVFLPKAAVWIEERGGLEALALSAIEAPLRFTLAGPVAGWLGDGTGMGFLSAFMMLAFAGVLTAGAAVFGGLGPRGA